MKGREDLRNLIMDRLESRGDLRELLQDRMGGRESLRELIMNRLEDRGDYGDRFSERAGEPEEQSMSNQDIRDLILDEASSGGHLSALNRLRERLGGRG